MERDKGDNNSVASDTAMLAPGDVADSKPIENEGEPEHRAILDLTINDQPVSFTLCNRHVFVAAPRCIEGPHAVHERDLLKMQHVLRVSQLPGHIYTDPPGAPH
jgi:hypothetical protein